MDKAIQEKIQFKIHSDEKREKLEIMTEENKNLRMKLQDIDDDSKKLKKQMKGLQMTLSLKEGLAEQVATLKNETQFANAQLKLKDKDHEESKRSIGNLQRALTSQFEEHSQSKK